MGGTSPARARADSEPGPEYEPEPWSEPEPESELTPSLGLSTSPSPARVEPEADPEAGPGPELSPRPSPSPSRRPIRSPTPPLSSVWVAVIAVFTWLSRRLRGYHALYVVLIEQLAVTPTVQCVTHANGPGGTGPCDWFSQSAARKYPARIFPDCFFTLQFTNLTYVSPGISPTSCKDELPRRFQTREAFC